MIWLVFLITLSVSGEPMLGNILQAPDRQMCIEVRDRVQALVPEGTEVFCEGVKLTNGRNTRI